MSDSVCLNEIMCKHVKCVTAQHYNTLIVVTFIVVISAYHAAACDTMNCVPCQGCCMINIMWNKTYVVSP